MIRAGFVNVSRTRTRFVNFERLQARGGSANTVIKLMMACNDLTLANQSLSDWKQAQPRGREFRQVGARQYFLRLQLAHLHEGLKVIEEIKRDRSLKALVQLCDSRTRESFCNLKQYLLGARKRSEFEQLIGRVRHNLTFHYDESGECIKRAVADRAARPEARNSSITRGDTAHLWHFKVADDVVDSIVVRQIWKVRREEDLRTRTDDVAGQVHKICCLFLDFAGEFIWKFCEI